MRARSSHSRLSHEPDSIACVDIEEDQDDQDDDDDDEDVDDEGVRVMLMELMMILFLWACLLQGGLMVRQPGDRPKGIGSP